METESFGQCLTLGQLIGKLSKVTQTKQLYFENIDQSGKGYDEIDDVEIRDTDIDPNRSGVGGLDSWRGSYEQLSLSPVLNIRTVEPTLSRLKEAVNEIFYGYKGGEYEMTEDTLIRCAPYSETGGYSRTKMTDWYDSPNQTLYLNLAIVDVKERENEVVILYEETEYMF